VNSIAWVDVEKNRGKKAVLSQMPSKFSSRVLPELVISGLGCRSLIKEEAETLGLDRILIVSSPSLRRTTGLVDDLARSLGSRLVGISDDVQSNNPDAALKASVERVRSLRVDGLVSIGGGAVHDAAKAFALMLPSGRAILEFVARFEPPDRMHVPEFDVDALPVLTVPSTFSAAEVFGGGAVTDIARCEKRLFFHPMLTPRRVFLDGEVVASTPVRILVQSGMNAVHHCLEALYAKGRQPITDAFALAALGELFAVLPLLVSPERGAPLTFQRAIEASALSGLTYGSSGLGIGHAVCHSLCGRYGLSHAAANAVIVRHSVRYNRDYAIPALARAGRFCSGAGSSALDTEAVDALITTLDRLCEHLNVPVRLKDLGLPEGEFEVISRDVMADPVTYTNPRPVAPADVVALLKSAW
jgi:alcohol dehydrogenase class IV